MKVADYISKSIQEYPLLYKDSNYEKSKLEVLNHVFFTTGNGLKVAMTKNPKEGGYITIPIMEPVNDDEECDYVRVFDKPYGKETYPPLPENYFENPIYTIHSFGEPVALIPRHDTFEVQYKKEDIERYGTPRVLECKSNFPFVPYSFDLRFNNCILSSIIEDKITLQQDWIDALIFLCEKTIEYFNDYELAKNDYEYPTNRVIKLRMRDYEDALKERGSKSLKEMRFSNGHEIKDTLPSYEEVKSECRKRWEKFRKRQLEVLIRIVEKFKTNKNA